VNTVWLSIRDRLHSCVIKEYKEKLLLTCIVGGMLVVVYPFCYSFRKKIVSSVLWSMDFGKGLPSPQEYVNKCKMNVKKNIELLE